MTTSAQLQVLHAVRDALLADAGVSALAGSVGCGVLDPLPVSESADVVLDLERSLSTQPRCLGDGRRWTTPIFLACRVRVPAGAADPYALADQLLCAVWACLAALRPADLPQCSDITLGDDIAWDLDRAGQRTAQVTVNLLIQHRTPSATLVAS